MHMLDSTIVLFIQVKYRSIQNKMYFLTLSQNLHVNLPNSTELKINLTETFTNLLLLMQF